MTLFKEATEAIAGAYTALGHTLGWRFLYTPARTLAPGTPLLFAGLNPGGRRAEPPAPSVEAGNAYRVEPWGPEDRLNPLQLQVCGLYEQVAAHLPGADRDTLMDSSLSANFCPFRSPSWAALPNRKGSVEFSEHLWARIFQVVAPPAILCLTELPARHFSTVLQRLGWTEIGVESAPVGWGSITYSIRTLRRAGRESVVVRLPHLSRFRIIGRPQSAAAVEHITWTIARSIEHLVA